MKSIFYSLFSILLMLGSVPAFAQIGMGTTTPAPSAALEVTSSANNKGILIPRITATQKDAIVSPAEGLLVYQTTVPIGFYYYMGTAWKLMAIQNDLASKVDKVDGKDLSTNDYTTTEKTKLSAIIGTNTGDQDLSPYATNIKVDQISTDVLNTFAKKASPTFTGTVVIPTLVAGTNRYPTNNGSSGQVLKTDGLGGLSWAAAAGGIPYIGATSAVNLGVYDLKVNGLTVGKGGGSVGTNTANGFNALSANTTGYYNTANGFNALSANTTGNYNTANGSFALQTNTTGESNTANGIKALYSNTEGGDNTANGKSALTANTTGYNNTAIGSDALYTNTTGSYNTAIGRAALQKNTTGGSNIATGGSALLNNTTGLANTANGESALFANISGGFNSANGKSALQNNTTGSNNTANGSQALYNNTTGGFNTANGMNALHANTTGSQNTVIGYAADVATAALTNATAIGASAIVSASNTIQLGNTAVTNVKTSGTITAGDVTYPNTHGTANQVLSTTGSGTLTWTTGLVSNTLKTISINPFLLESPMKGSEMDVLTAPNLKIGNDALNNLTNGIANIAVGDGTLYNNTVGAANVGIGYKSMYKNTEGTNNTAVGNYSSYNNQKGSWNSAFGSLALASDNSAGDNSAFGAWSLAFNTSGIQNTGSGGGSLQRSTIGNGNSAFGYAALLENTTGSYNTSIGWYASEYNTIGNNNTAIGYRAGGSSANLTNTTAIGNDAKVSASNAIQLGNTAVTKIGGQVAWTSASDIRLKKDITNTKYGLSTVLQLRPVDYILKSNELKQVGFIAQEVKKLIPEVVNGKEGDLSKGEFLGITYENIVPVLAKAIQEQQKQIEELKLLILSIKK